MRAPHSAFASPTALGQLSTGKSNERKGLLVSSSTHNFGQFFKLALEGTGVSGDIG